MNDTKQSHNRFEQHLKSLVLNGPFDGIEHKSHATQCLNHWGDTKHGTENFRLLQERRRAEAKLVSRYRTGSDSGVAADDC